jgi:hypothetical protein
VEHVREFGQNAVPEMTGMASARTAFEVFMTEVRP